MPVTLRCLESCEAFFRDKSQFYTLMLSHPNVLAGAPLKEMDVYFYGTECYNRLSLHDRQEVYQRAQVELRSRARRDFLVRDDYLKEKSIV